MVFGILMDLSTRMIQGFYFIISIFTICQKMHPQQSFKFKFMTELLNVNHKREGVHIFQVFPEILGPKS